MRDRLVADFFSLTKDTGFVTPEHGEVISLAECQKDVETLADLGHPVTSCYSALTGRILSLEECQDEYVNKLFSSSPSEKDGKLVTPELLEAKGVLSDYTGSSKSSIPTTRKHP